MDSFTHLLAGHDTVECAYYLHDLSAGEGIGLEALHLAKEAVRQDRKRRPKLVTLGGVEFYLYSGAEPRRATRSYSRTPIQHRLR